MPSIKLTAVAVLTAALVGHALATILFPTEHPDGGESTAARSAPAPPSPAQLEAQEPQRVLDFYTRNHGQESRDGSWSRTHEHEIGDFLATEAFAGSSVESVDCRTSQCRVVVIHHDAAAALRLRGAWGHGPFRYGGSSHFDESTQSTILFLGRKGYEFQHPRFGTPLDDGG